MPEPEIDEELLNRCIVLTVDEEREQTRAIHRLLTDTQLRNRIVPAARGRVAARFDNRRLIDDLAAVLKAEGL